MNLFGIQPLKFNAAQATAAAASAEKVPEYKLMYGVIFIDHLRNLKLGLASGIELIEQGLKNKVFTGQEEKEVKEALVHLRQASVDLKVPGGEIKKPDVLTARAQAFTAALGDYQSLYAVVIRTEMQKLRDWAQSFLDQVTAAIKSGEMTGTDLTDSKQVKFELEKVVRILK